MSKQIDNPLSLRIVSLEKVIPHETVDPRRVARLAARLEADGLLANPPIVAQADDQYIVLDGATRVTALKKLNVPHVVVQVVDPHQGVKLDTWFHVIRQVEPARLIELLNNLTEIHLKETDASHVLNEMAEYGGLCYLHLVDDQVFLIQPAPTLTYLQALNKLAETYIGAGHISRTLNNNIINLREEYPDLTALVVFSQYTIEQILQIALAGRVVPAGITRFIIPRRVLRINISLEQLRADKPLLEKNQWLYQLVVTKLNEGGARYYEESVYLLDE